MRRVLVALSSTVLGAYITLGLLFLSPSLVAAQGSPGSLLATVGPPDGTGGCGGIGPYSIFVIGGTISRTGDSDFNTLPVGFRCWQFAEAYTRLYIVADDPATFDHWESLSGHLSLIDGHNGTSTTTIETSLNLLGQNAAFVAVHNGGDPVPYLATVDTGSGAESVVGTLASILTSSYPALAVHPSSSAVYTGGGGGEPVLLTVDPETASLTGIGSSQPAVRRVASMDFRDDGTLFASVNVLANTGRGGNYLATIDTSTGAASLIGPFGSCSSSCSIDGMEAISFDESGVLYGALHERAYAGTPGLYTIDTSTGGATFVAAIVDSLGDPASGGITALQFADGVLYGGTALSKSPPGDGGWLVTIDKTTGVFSKVGPSSATGGMGINELAYPIPGFHCSDQSEIPASECETLVAVFDSTNGETWSNKSGWKDSTTPCSWFGVTCSEGYVTEIRLSSNIAGGSIPSAIGDLTHLVHLEMNSDHLTGPIPPSLGSLTNLQHLNLGGNDLSGSIPSELGSLASLVTLSLQGNELTGTIPDELGNLTNAVELLLNFNGLTGEIPAALSGLVSAETIELSHNALSDSIPSGLGTLPSLRYLGLDDNELSGMIPAGLGNASSLTALMLRDNALDGAIPSSLGQLDSLVALGLRGNGLTGPIPSSLGNLSVLQYLDLAENALSGPIPAALGRLSNIVWMDLSDNELSGAIPPELGRVVSNSSCEGCFSYFDLRFNELSGTVPLPVARAAVSGVLGCYLTDNVPGLCIPDIPGYQALGDPICGLALDPACQPVVHLEARILLEGPYGGGMMSTSSEFKSSRPEGQPYMDAVFDGTPRSYAGVEISALPADSLVDWLLLSLRTDPSAASEVAASRRAVLLRTDGWVVDTSGGLVAFPGVSPAGYYLVVRHRNHVSTMSADTLDLSDGIGSWDFTSAVTQAYSSGGDPMKAVGEGNFGMFACDAAPDDLVTAPDFNIWNASTSAGETGYLQADCDLDGIVTAPDFNLWNANTTAGAASQVPD